MYEYVLTNIFIIFYVILLLMYERWGRPVLLFRNPWKVSNSDDDNADIIFDVRIC